MQYIYLHGFASGPKSRKAQDLCDRFQQMGRSLHVPDLNQGDFSHLTLSRQIEQVYAEYLTSEEPTTIIGSSFGGLTAAWLGQRYFCVERLILLAPAFQFLTNWQPKIPSDQWQQWQKTDAMDIYHYSHQQRVPLKYGFVTDLSRYDDAELTRPVPTRIIHGIDDDVVPIQVSQSYGKGRSHVSLLPVNSDHFLGDQLAIIWTEIIHH